MATKLPPKDSFTIESQMDAEAKAIAQKLALFISPRPMLGWSRAQQQTLYHGSISAQGFELTRSINHRNSFLPLIKGRFEALPQGTAVHVTMALQPIIIAFCTVWYLSWYSIGIPVFLWGGMPWTMVMILLGMPLLIGFIFWRAFWAEAKRSCRDLLQMIGGQLQDTDGSRDKLGFSVLP